MNTLELANFWRILHSQNSRDKSKPFCSQKYRLRESLGNKVGKPQVAKKMNV